jgi:phenylpyruvate tautomerase PptA (4-oxalocrotonate tautomerase family)
MPLLEIEIIGPLEATEPAALAQHLADAAGAVFGSPPQSTWVRVRTLDRSAYAENGGGDPAVRPVFVKVTKRSNPEGASIADEIKRLTLAIAEACGRPPENVHVCYEAPAAGRQAFGGELV